MLTLDPRFPLLWRSTTSIQFGLDVRARIDDVQPWQERFIHELDRGVPDVAADAIARSFGAPDGDVYALIDAIRPALLTDQPIAPRLIVDAGDVPIDIVAAFVSALGDAGHSVTRDDGAYEPGAGAAARDIVILLGVHALHPRRAEALLARDARHLAVVFRPGAAQVGPLVTPGAGPCLGCLAAAARDRDPLWPVLTTQLIGRPLPTGLGTLVVEAAGVAGRLARAGTPGRSVTVRADDPAPLVVEHPQHPWCACGSLEGIATVDGSASPEPTRATASGERG